MFEPCATHILGTMIMDDKIKIIPQSRQSDPGVGQIF
jgi:hypothetical protein